MSCRFCWLSCVASRATRLAVACFLAASIAGVTLADDDARLSTDQDQAFPATPEAAIERLEAGNDRFVAGHPDHPHETGTYRHQLADGQHPFATILGCSDSRVPPDLLFDQGFGDLFVIRVAGNVVDPEVSGSIEYAVDQLGTPLVVVLGHQSCGAVTAALDTSGHGEHEPHEIEQLLDGIRPALSDLHPTDNHGELVAEAVEANVRHSVEELSGLAALRSALDAGRIRIVGAVYDLDTGRVRFLD